ncbi:YihY/virulence factor BrkB family protein [Paeniglutamicibacter cryotolerans]|nr:YihY/virulence factor BrkB family protein [Paeniglutamicibacter cryotolerans]
MIQSTQKTADSIHGVPPDSVQDTKPTRFSPALWKYAALRTFREFSRDGGTDLAASLTYFAVLALFPGLLALVSLLGIIGQAQATTDFLLQTMDSVASPEVVAAVRGPIEQLAGASGAGFAFVAGLLGALWSASGYVGAFGRALNRVYAMDEGRPLWKLRPAMLLLTLVIVLLAVISITILLLSGPVARGIGNAVGLGDETLMLWNIAKWPVLALVAVLMVAVLYYFTPNVRRRKFRFMSLGAFGALIILAVATVGFFFYVSNFSNYNRTYGSIGGVIVLLLWLWIGNISLLLGAEFDAELERARELQAGIPAEEKVLLPPRESTAIIKKELARYDDVDRGRALRVSLAGATETQKLEPAHFPWRLAVTALGTLGAYLLGRRHAGR